MASLAWILPWWSWRIGDRSIGSRWNDHTNVLWIFVGQLRTHVSRNACLLASSITPHTKSFAVMGHFLCVCSKAKKRTAFKILLKRLEKAMCALNTLVRNGSFVLHSVQPIESKLIEINKIDCAEEISLLLSYFTLWSIYMGRYSFDMNVKSWILEMVW